MEIGTLFNLPAHPLIVHIPVIGIPLMVLAVIAYMVVPSKPTWLFWASGILTTIVAIATVAAAGSGEQLEEMLPQADQGSTLVSRHAALGEQTEFIVLAFAGVALAYLALDWWRRRRGTDASGIQISRIHLRATSVNRLLTVLLAAAIIAGSAATVWDVRTGHAGAKSSWEDVVSSSGE